MSKIVQGQNECETTKPEVINETKLDLTVTNKGKDCCMGCQCSKQNVSIDESAKIGSFIEKLLRNNNKGKATVKIEIQFDG